MARLIFDKKFQLFLFFLTAISQILHAIEESLNVFPDQ